jgi:ribonuclease-3
VRLQQLDREILESPEFAIAITHRSVGGQNNERLEFLGDSILGLIITEWLYKQLPDASEGHLSRLRALLVRKETLAEIGKDLKLGERLRLGEGELKSGGFRRPSILADAFEAVIGAIYLVKGLPYTEGFIKGIYAQRFDNLPTEDELKDPKTRLQEYLQGKGYSPPSYEVIKVSGKPHEQEFQVVCRIEAMSRQTTAMGRSRKRAEQQAAEDLLKSLTE